MQNTDARLNFNYLDRLIAGEESEFKPSLRYWRTRYLLVPSGKDPLAMHGVVPDNENFDPSEILMSGASKVIDIINRHRWDSSSDSNKLLVLPTTFDPSACVLDEGLMIELDRMRNGKEATQVGKTLVGLPLTSIGEMMCQPNNGLVIRDRWWHCESTCITES
jgi:hypothetical protein